MRLAPLQTWASVRWCTGKLSEILPFVALVAIVFIGQ